MSIYTTFLFTKLGGGFFKQCFTVNKSMPVLFLGCSFCALKNFKMKKTQLTCERACVCVSGRECVHVCVCV